MYPKTRALLALITLVALGGSGCAFDWNGQSGVDERKDGGRRVDANMTEGKPAASDASLPMPEALGPGCDGGLCDSPSVCDASSCSCTEGFVLDAQGACRDVDECSLDLDNCDTAPNACINTQGAFMCSCPPGYEGEGIGDGGCVAVPPKAGLAYWYRAESCSAGGACTDLSGHKDRATSVQGGPAVVIVADGIGGKPTLRFEKDAYIYLPTVPVTLAYTLSAVVRAYDGSARDYASVPGVISQAWLHVDSNTTYYLPSALQQYQVTLVAACNGGSVHRLFTSDLTDAAGAGDGRLYLDVDGTTGRATVTTRANAPDSANEKHYEGASDTMRCDGTPFLLTLRASKTLGSTEVFVNGARVLSIAKYMHARLSCVWGSRDGVTLTGTIAEALLHIHPMDNAAVLALHRTLATKYGLVGLVVGDK